MRFLLVAALCLLSCACSATTHRTSGLMPVQGEIFITVPGAEEGPLSVSIDYSGSWAMAQDDTEGGTSTTLVNVTSGARIRITPTIITDEVLLAREEERDALRTGYATLPCTDRTAYGNWAQRTCMRKRHESRPVDGQTVWLRFDRLPHATVAIQGIWARGDAGAERAMDYLVATARVSRLPGSERHN